MTYLNIVKLKIFPALLRSQGMPINKYMVSMNN